MEEAQKTKACSECGETIRATAEICPKCGVRQHDYPHTFANLNQRTILGFPFLVLQEGETITATARKHWFPYLFSAFLLTGMFDYFLGEVHAGIFGILFTSLIICAICFWLYYLARLTSVMLVTDKRVVTKTGLINIKTMEFTTFQIETVGFIQNFIGQFFDFGTLIVIGTGGTKVKIRDIEHPLELRKAVISKLKS
ncbi:MAG TPA: PH domain-containing protein [Alphaproteobacteria bacterium]|nr:PH domain-containing protein [Alphaproteobacteria bacterium]